MADVTTAGAPGHVPWWVRALDALIVALVAAWVVVLVTGGIRTTIAGVRLSVTSEFRLLVWACGLAIARRFAHRRVTLSARINDSRAIAALRWVFGVSRLVVVDAAPWCADDGAKPSRRRTVGEYVAVAAAVTVLTVLVTYPQVVSLDMVRDPGDPLFSIWRLAWVAHQLPRDPLHLFDANIFYPAKHTLALSDSLLLPGIVCAPFIWLGVSAVRVYNVCFVVSFVLSGVAMYALVRALTRNRAAALVAGVAFAFYPFRFDHYSHFELQLSFWMPLALLALHRAIATGRTRYGLMAGVAFAAQVFSCLYFGLFLAVFLLPVWAVVSFKARATVTSLRPLIAGAVLAGVLIAPLAWQYLAARDQFGSRSIEEIAFYSAVPARYLAAPPVLAVWGAVKLPVDHVPEQELFPGLLVVVLAVVALWPPLSGACLAYLVALLVAYDASLGVHGHVYPPLHQYFSPFRSIRVPARLSMLVGLALTVLAGYGAARVTKGLRRPAARYAVAAVLCAVICLETRPVLSFDPPYRVHAIYAWLSARPTSVIAELPTPGASPDRYWEDVRYQYFSTFHWHKLLNGNSGILPVGYVRFSTQMTTFPDDASLALLRASGAQLVVVHEEFYKDAAAYRRVVDASAGRADLAEVARAVDRGTEARVYKLVR